MRISYYTFKNVYQPQGYKSINYDPATKTCEIVERTIVKPGTHMYSEFDDMLAELGGVVKEERVALTGTASESHKTLSNGMVVYINYEPNSFDATGAWIMPGILEESSLDKDADLYVRLGRNGEVAVAHHADFMENTNMWNSNRGYRVNSNRYKVSDVWNLND